MPFPIPQNAVGTETPVVLAGVSRCRASPSSKLGCRVSGDMQAARRGGRLRYLLSRKPKILYESSHLLGAYRQHWRWKGEASKTSGFSMEQKNPRSHAALVLIVDDDEAVVEITAEILETLGYDILTARNRSEAVELLRKNSRISVLFTDVQMPGIGGEELAEIALTLRPGIRVVFTSGFQTPPRNAAFVPKPYRAVDLIRVLPPQALTS